MALDPYLEQQLAKAAGLPPMSSVPVAKIRAGDVRRCSTGLALADVRGVQDLSIPGPRGPLRLRVYTPHVPETAAPLPLTVFFHGSGFVICSIESHDEMCRHLCKGAGSVVVSVDYALAPEQPFPAAPDDCLAAVRWIAANAAQLGGDANRLALAGDSAGANLATVTSLRLRGAGDAPVVKAQLLMYPVTDHYSGEHGSYAERGQGFGLTRDDMVWFWNHYLPDPDSGAVADAFPLRATDLANLPPALIVTAEYDLLRDEGRAYARRLREAGVSTTLLHYEDANHGFMFWVGRMASATAAMGAACVWLKERLI